MVDSGGRRACYRVVEAGGGLAGGVVAGGGGGVAMGGARAFTYSSVTYECVR